jgi:hypothetical protein
MARRQVKEEGRKEERRRIKKRQFGKQYNFYV